jgi:intraflagellar transport protein 172
MKAAHKLESAGKLLEAEKLYLLVREPDLAINMYKKARKYKDMVRLVTAHRKELLTETHLHLAQQLEAEGKFAEAELHFVDADEWKAALNMYRDHDMWEEAVRVAKSKGGPAASKQVAYAWAVSLGGEAGAKLLSKYGLSEQAIDYATESGTQSAFDHAFSLARASMKSKLPEVFLKYAMFLEDEGRFKEAEDAFVAADKPKEAIDMYTHQQDWAAAMRVAEQNDPSSVNDVLCAQAKAFVDGKDLVKAEALFLKAKKPELAVKAYKDAGRWNEAIKLTREFLPFKLAEINADYQRFQRGDYVADGASGGGGGGGGAGEELLALARQLEAGREFSKAIDAYLRVGGAHSSDPNFLEAAWEHGVRVAMAHVSHRTAEVVATVAQRLVELGRHAQAAELYEGIGSYRQALEVYMQGGLWEPARQLYKAQAPQFGDLVESRYVAHLQGNQDGDQLVSHGRAAEGLDVYAQRNDWKRALEVAQSQGPAMVLKYATLHGSVLVNGGEYLEAARVFGTYGTDVTQPALVGVYRRLYATLLSDAPQSSAHAEARAELKELRMMLVKVIAALRAAGEAPAVIGEFERAQWVSTLAAAKALAAQKGLKASALKLAFALLKYLVDIPADKAFYDAGMACKAAGKLNMAFVCLNR